jgi:dTDP-4-amino-4,6-dideoxygalactose transaminase
MLHRPQTSLPTWPSFAEDEIEAAAAVLRSGKVNYWTGEEGRQFEKEYAAYIGCAHSVAVANGTVALELALRALEIGAGDDVVVPSRSYFATASSVVAVGARPVFADVDRDSQNITAETIRAAVTPRTRAVVVVHLAGWPCAMDAILQLATQFDLKVVEDCAQAHGAIYRGRKVGSFGDIGSFSFCQEKIMTTAGEGGMVTTRSRELWERMWAYKDHGKDYNSVYTGSHAPGFRWQHASFGTNWRLTEVQAAVGRLQLVKLPGWLAARRNNGLHLMNGLRKMPGLRVPQLPADIEHAFYKGYAFVEPGLLAEGWDRDRIMQAVNSAGVPCSSGSCSEIYLEAAFPPEWRPVARLPIARELGATSLMFQVHPTLTREHINHVCGVVEQVMREATVGRKSGHS